MHYLDVLQLTWVSCIGKANLQHCKFATKWKYESRYTQAGIVCSNLLPCYFLIGYFKRSEFCSGRTLRIRRGAGTIRFIVR